jgi:hypothetical protein
MTTAYKGYLIRQSMHGYHVSKNGHHITTCSTLADAKAAINLLTE